jgi:hypothetical protein
VELDVVGTVVVPLGPLGPVVAVLPELVVGVGPELPLGPVVTPGAVGPVGPPVVGAGVLPVGPGLTVGLVVDPVGATGDVVVG